MALKVIAKETLAKEKPTAAIKPGFKLSEHLKIVEQSKGRTVVEFIGTDNFGSQWYERQRYEIDAGREQEPQLWQPLYRSVVDPSLPRNVTIYQLGPAGVIFDEVKEGGEVQFASVGEGNYSVPIKHYAVGLEYNKDLVIYNELWNLSIVERQAGIAFNALMNHIHLNPFLTAAYGAANQTAANTNGDSLPEAYLRTFEDAITNAVTDTANPRRGPYALLCSTSNLFAIERALTRVGQQGFDLQSSAIGRIGSIIAYDGWSGTRGQKTVSHSGVTANKAYLISLGHKDVDHQSFTKQPLQSTVGNGDVSRFILEQVIWDTYFGVYANPIASTEEITLPTTFS